MLVITRHAGQDFLIGENVRVIILEVHASGLIRVGIQAPREIAVMRGEIADRPIGPHESPRTRFSG